MKKIMQYSIRTLQGIDSTDAHSALSDSIMTAKVLKIVKKTTIYLGILKLKQI